MFLVVVIMPHLIANNLVGYQYAYVTSYVMRLITHPHCNYQIISLTVSCT